RYLLPLPFLFTYPAPPALYTLSLHDALPISTVRPRSAGTFLMTRVPTSRKLSAVSRTFSTSSRVSWLIDSRCLIMGVPPPRRHPDRKSTRVNSSHVSISYAVFCLKKKKQKYL